MPSGLVALRAEIAKRFSVQLHMVLILAACFGVGLTVTKLLLMAGIGAMWLRYSVALVFAYAAFLAGIRLWLAYAGYGAPLGESVRDSLSSLTNSGSSNSGWSGIGGGGRGGGATPGFRGGGGGYGGGGASESFAEASSAGTAARSVPFVSAISSTSDSHVGGDGGNDHGGDQGGCSGIRRPESRCREQRQA